MPDQHGADVVSLRARRSHPGGVHIRTSVRNAKVAYLPVAYGGRRVVGVGKRLLGSSAEEIDRDIRIRTAQHVFEVLGDLKGCAQKMGQLLSIFETALPPELAEPYREALGRLQDSGPAMLPSLVHRAMADSMGKDWRNNFQAFGDNRAAAASIGQVHRAVWRDGTPVAVKVMYPGVREAVLNELEQAQRLAPILGAAFPGASMRQLAEALHDCVSEELDYQREADYQRAFAASYSNDPDFVVPRIIAQQGDVLISEWVEGTPVSRLMSSSSQKTRNRIGISILRFVMTSVERTGYLYGDPHPGNFQILADGRVGVVDFGACSPCPPPGFCRLVRDVGDAVLNGGNEKLEAAFRLHGFVSEGQDLDVEALRADIAPIRELFIPQEVCMSGSWLQDRLRRATDPRLSNVIRQLTLPPELTSMARTIVIMTGVLCQLGCSGPLRNEILDTVPALADLIQQFELRS